MRRLALGLLALSALAPTALAEDITVHAGTASDGSLYFEPRDITVKQGERVTISIVNDDPGTPHDWALLEYDGHDVEGYVRGGETKTIAFTATEKGEYRVVCQVVGHKQRGMEGTLTVEGKLLPAGGAPGAALALGLALALRRRAA